MDENERFSRQRDIVPQERLAACRITVIGLGAIGRQVALQLAALGAARLQLVDFDRVEPSNLSSQGFLEKDLNRSKVEAVADLCRQINSHLEIQLFAERFRKSRPVGNVIFCCVDSIETRKQIWQAVCHKADFFADGRMAAEVLRVVTVTEANGRWCYDSTLFNGEDAYAGPCTAKTTIYCANIAAGLMVGQFTKWLRRLPVDFDCQLNLLSGELAAFPPAVVSDFNPIPKGKITNDRPSLRKSDEPVPAM
jgi:sulfur carrier protein ThiS adenylyltransferase